MHSLGDYFTHPRTCHVGWGRHSRGTSDFEYRKNLQVEQGTPAHHVQISRGIEMGKRDGAPCMTDGTNVSKQYPLLEQSLSSTLHRVPRSLRACLLRVTASLQNSLSCSTRWVLRFVIPENGQFQSWCWTTTAIWVLWWIVSIHACTKSSCE